MSRQFERHIEACVADEEQPEDVPAFEEAEEEEEEQQEDEETNLGPRVASVDRKWRGNGIDIRLSPAGAVIGRLGTWGRPVPMECKLRSHTKCRRALSVNQMPNGDNDLVEWLLRAYGKDDHGNDITDAKGHMALPNPTIP